MIITLEQGPLKALHQRVEHQVGASCRKCPADLVHQLLLSAWLRKESEPERKSKRKKRAREGDREIALNRWMDRQTETDRRKEIES